MQLKLFVPKNTTYSRNLTLNRQSIRDTLCLKEVIKFHNTFKGAKILANAITLVFLFRRIIKMFLQGEVIMHFENNFGLICETIKAFLHNLSLNVFSHVSQLVTGLIIKLNALKSPNHEIWNWNFTILKYWHEVCLI